jgi:hypothetical protein
MSRCAKLWGPAEVRGRPQRLVPSFAERRCWPDQSTHPTNLPGFLQSPESSPGLPEAVPSSHAQDRATEYLQFEAKALARYGDP